MHNASAIFRAKSGLKAKHNFINDSANAQKIIFIMHKCTLFREENMFIISQYEKPQRFGLTLHKQIYIHFLKYCTKQQYTLFEAHCFFFLFLLSYTKKGTKNGTIIEVPLYLNKDMLVFPDLQAANFQKIVMKQVLRYLERINVCI